MIRMTEQNVSIICSHNVEMIQVTITEQDKGRKVGGRINSLIA